MIDNFFVFSIYRAAIQGVTGPSGAVGNRGIISSLHPEEMNVEPETEGRR